MPNTADKAFGIFESRIGICGIAWQDSGIIRLQLPEKTPTLTKRRLKESLPTSKEMPIDQAPAWIQDSVRLIERHLQSGCEDLATLRLDYSEAPPFHQKVYAAALQIGPSETLSYGDIAKRIGSPGSARAVGQALGKNPIALIIPCHRVLAAGGKPGGFSAWGGLETKDQLLQLEAAAALQRQGAFALLAEKGGEQLRKKDPTLAKLIDQVGPCTLIPKLSTSAFVALTGAIVYQQLTAKAASTILARFQASFAGVDFPSPAMVLAKSEEELRSVGLSRSKAASIQDLARKMQAGELPDFAAMQSMTNDEIIAALTTVRGVGRWTAEMLLIFDLGRSDVMPASDYGIRKGFAKTYKKRELPEPAALTAFSARWRPYQSIAAWYLWRSLDKAD